MDTSLLIAKILGLAFLGVGVGIVGNTAYYRKLTLEVVKSRSLLYLDGFASLSLGAVLTSIHDTMVGWPVVITVLGWVFLAYGLFAVALPEHGGVDLLAHRPRLQGCPQKPGRPTLPRGAGAVGGPWRR